MATSAGVKENEELKVRNRELVSNNRNMLSFAKSAKKGIARLQKEIVLMKNAKGGSAFVPSGVKELAAQQDADKAAGLAWQLRKVQNQMMKMKQEADTLWPAVG